MYQAIKQLSVNMLHNYIDINLNFTEGLNVIYGKNGKGKTTVLHIIANILELDFQRFRHIKFNSIKAVSFNDSILQLTKDYDGRITVLFNDKQLGLREDSFFPNLSLEEQQEVRIAFGGRPVYLPAYRSILEKVKAVGNPYERDRSVEYDKIKRKEITEFSKDKGGIIRHRQEQRAGMVAFKTLQCRDWFGPFVPTIRYPGLNEVIEIIGEEFNEAQMGATQAQSQMLNSIFVGVLNSITAKDETPSDFEVEPLLSRVRNALDDSQNQFRSNIVTNKLVETVRQAKFAGAQDNNATKRVLKLYADMLERLKDDNDRIFKKIKSFESAVNEFFDDKSLEISSNFAAKHHRWGEYAFVKENDNEYPLTTLSSGERQILTMLFTASRMSTDSTGIFLIDEPELSLHIDWQRIILSQLIQQATDRQIIACTHSPEVGADHPDAVLFFSPVINTQNSSTEDDESYLDERE